LSRWWRCRGLAWGSQAAVAGAEGHRPLRREEAAGEDLPVVGDADRAVEVLADLDAGFGIAAATGTRQDLDQMLFERHRVVIGDDAIVFDRGQ